MNDLSESEEQQTLITWWHTAGCRLAPGAVLFAIPNGGRRAMVTAARMKREGVLPGVPDLMLAAPQGASHGLFIEMKRAAAGRPSQAQKTVMAALTAQGYQCVVAHGFHEARKAIEGYLTHGRGQ